MQPTVHPLNITIISHSDIIGGAAIAMTRLMRALAERGHQVTMLVFTKFTDLPQVQSIGGTPTRRLAHFSMERLRIFAANGFSRDNLFKVSIATDGFELAHHPAVTGADIVMLGWINQGMVSLEAIRRLAESGKPIVWVMHDLWNCTGACHYPHECRRYEQMCGNCPYFRHGRRERDMSRLTWWRKKQLYDHADIDFVAVSEYVAHTAADSTLMRDRRVSIIPNTFPPNIFTPRRAHNNPYGLPRDKHIIVMSAARLDTRIKGLDIAIRAFNRLFDNDPALTNTTEVVLVGEIRDRSALEELRFPYRTVGVVHGADAMADIYAMADVMLSTALYETFGLTILEGMACGATPVTFGNDGRDDIVRHKVNGYIARHGDADDIAAGIRWALDARLDRQTLHEDALERFSPDIVISYYDRLFADILERRARPAAVPTLADIHAAITAATRRGR